MVQLPWNHESPRAFSFSPLGSGTTQAPGCLSGERWWFMLLVIQGLVKKQSLLCDLLVYLWWFIHKKGYSKRDKCWCIFHTVPYSIPYMKDEPDILIWFVVMWTPNINSVLDGDITGYMVSWCELFAPITLCVEKGGDPTSSSSFWVEYPISLENSAETWLACLLLTVNSKSKRNRTIAAFQLCEVVSIFRVPFGAVWLYCVHDFVYPS